MSSLWTPGGEVPVDRKPSPEPSPEPSPKPGPDAGADPAGSSPDAPSEAEYEQMREQLLGIPAADVIAQHAMGFYELAALHLSQPQPRLPDARLAIDALAALVDALEGRLGAAEEPLRAALPQLRMAFVEISDRAKADSAPPG